MALYTTDLLLASIERQSFSPANQSTFTSADMLSLADETTVTSILPAILGAREEYYISTQDFTITTGQSNYAINQRSVGLTVRMIQLIDSSGNIYELPRIAPEKLSLFSGASSTPVGYYLQANDIVIFPTPTTTLNTLRVFFPLRPGNLVSTTAIGVVSAIDSVLNTVTLTTIPSTWITGNSFDFISQASGHSYIAIDQVSSLVSGSVISLSSIPSRLTVGDYISIAGQSALVQMPPDFCPILAQFVASEMLLDMNQPNGEKLLAKAARNLEVATKMLLPRTVGEQELILPDWT